MAVQIQDFNLCMNPEHSPNQSPLSTSPSPEQRHSPQGNNPNHMAQEQSLHVIVEPEMNGQTNIIYLINPPTGEMISSVVAEHGALIEIQPGVFFQVPFPHEQAFHQTGPPLHHQHMPPNFPPPYAVNLNTQNIQNTNMIPGSYNVHDNFSNQNCPMHNCMNTNYLQTGNARIDKRREKLQKKSREKNVCTCKPNLHFENYNGIYMHDKKPYQQEGVQIQGENGLPEGIQDMEEEKDLTICVPPKAKVENPYMVIVTWEECILNNTHLQDCVFDLQMSENRNKYKTVFSGQSNTFTACQLQPGTEYFFRLCALWNNKRGPFSEPVSCTTYITNPDPPSSIRVTQRSKTALTLKWNAPLNDGGSDISSYKLQWKKGQDASNFIDLYTGLIKQYKHSHKLPPGTQCLFRVLATNEKGNSDWSDIFRCLTSAGPPVTPDKPILVDYGTNYVRLKWTEPDSNGAPIEEYKLEMEDPNDDYGFIVKYHGEGTSYCCQNLRRNTSYTFRLSASNSQGYSRFSTPVSYTTLPEAPGRMEKPRINGKPRTTSLPVKWDPPRDSGGIEIISYVLEADDGNDGPFNGVYQGTEKEFLLFNLKPGHTYKIRVASESKAGKGAWSPTLSGTTLPVCPRDCVPPRCAKATPNSLYIEWDTPRDTGGAPINKYIVQMASTLQEGEFEQVYTGCKRACCVTDLLPGKEYYFRSQATNHAGTSQWSPISVLETAPSAPDAPDVPVVSFKSPTHLRLDWIEPELHGAEVTSYTVEKLENDAFQKVYQGTCCFCEIKRNLCPATHYYFRLQAHSTAGNSPFSNVFTIETPPSTPSAVAEIKVIEQTSNSCLIQWRHPVENGSRVYEYILEATGATSIICTAQRPTISSIDPNTSLDDLTRSDRSDHSSIVDGESDAELAEDEYERTESMNGSEASSSIASKNCDEFMEYRLTGLIADASYKVRIQAVNAVGNSPFSHPIQFYTKELPPNPPTLSSSSVSHQSIKLKWGDSSLKKSLAILQYNLQIQNKSGSFSSVYSGTGTSYTINKLQELTPYCCRIRSKNDAGEGEFSKVKILHTKAQPPHIVKEFSSKDVTHTSLKLTWSPTDKQRLRDDDVIEYKIQMLENGNAKEFKQIYKGTKNSCKVENLNPETSYQFRIQAVRILSDNARMNVPSAPTEVKGAFAPLRVKTSSENAFDESFEGDQVELTPEQEMQGCKLTDTRLALIILITFLIICALIAGLLRWVMGDLQL